MTVAYSILSQIQQAVALKPRRGSMSAIQWLDRKVYTASAYLP